jgi:putative NADPH-quinone reductase
MSNIVVVIGNPFAESFSHALAESYASRATQAGAHVRVIDLAQNEFPTIPRHLNQVRVRGTDHLDELDPAITQMIEDMEWADHFTFVYPVWWGTYPVALKAFIDRVVLSGVAFKYGKTGTKWEKLWSGKTARLIITMDAPSWWYKLVYRAPSENSLRWATLWYVGVKTLGITRFTPIRFSTPEIRAKWLTKVASLASKDAR